MRVSGTLVYLPGSGTVRRDKPKTVGSIRTVPLSADAVEALRARAEHFGIDPANLGDWADRPIVGSPQHPERWRDRRNLSRDVATLYTKQGLDYGRGHVGPQVAGDIAGGTRRPHQQDRRRGGPRIRRHHPGIPWPPGSISRSAGHRRALTPRGSDQHLSGSEAMLGLSRVHTCWPRAMRLRVQRRGGPAQSRRQHVRDRGRS